MAPGTAPRVVQGGYDGVVCAVVTNFQLHLHKMIEADDLPSHSCRCIYRQCVDASVYQGTERNKSTTSVS